MQNEIVSALAGRLDELFDGEYPIYTDPAEQGLKNPCFFIGVLKTDVQPMLGRRRFRSWDLRVQFLPKENGDQNSRLMDQVSERLMEEMEYIELTDGTLMRGTDRSCASDDQVLTFLIRFGGFFLKPETPADPMERLELKGEVP